MAEFDPDAYLAEKPKPGFDPDAYLGPAERPTKTAAKAKVSTILDAIQAVPGGIYKGLSGIAGVPADLMRLGMGAVGIPTREGPLPATVTAVGPEGGAYGTSTELADLTRPEAGYYEPKTAVGKYTERAAEFLPAIFGGEAGLGARALGRVLAPAGGSFAGDLVDKKEHPLASALLGTGGAVLAGGSVGGARAGLSRLTQPAQTAEQTGDQYIARLFEQSGKTPGDIAGYPVGRGAIAAEAIGPIGVGAAATLARRPGATGEALANLLTERTRTASQRILGDLSKVSGIQPEAAQGNMQNIVKAGRASAGPLYDKALARPPVTTDYLDRFAADPDIKKGMSIGIRNAQREALAENKPFDPNAYAITKFDAAGDPVIGPVPTWRTWDAAKNGLDDMLEKYRNPITKHLDLDETGRAIEAVRKSLVKELDSVNPDYAAARGASADYLSANEAFTTAGKHLNPGTTAAQVSDYLARLNPANREAYKAGLANQLYNQAQNNRLRPGALLTPSTKAKLTAALGQDGADTFITGLEQEAALAKTGARMMPGAGSITSDVLMNSGEQDLSSALKGVAHGGLAMKHLAAGKPIAALTSALTAAGHYGYDLTKGGAMAPEARDAAGRLLMLSPDEFAAKAASLNELTKKNPKLISQLLMLK